jgi:hypothetical protein
MSSAVGYALVTMRLARRRAASAILGYRSAGRRAYVERHLSSSASSAALGRARDAASRAAKASVWSMKAW